MNYSYITFLSNDSYVYGVALLKACLTKVSSQYPLSVLTTNGVSNSTKEILKQLNINTIDVETINMSDIIKQHNIKVNPALANTWKDCWTKFKIFDLIQFDKIVFLDADIMIQKNLDHLFNLPHMTAALDGEYFNLWPDWPHFNSGCLVIEPNHQEFINILNFANNLKEQDLDKKQVYADQEILNIYYKDWINQNELHLNKYYNIFAPYIQEKHKQDIENNCYFIHYTGRKPWAFFIKNEHEVYIEYFYEKARDIINSINPQINWNLIYNKLIVSVYAICKNEKENIDKWLKCFSKADYVCILDTGSTDGTWEKLQEYKKIYPNLILDQKIITPWRFDAARNYSLELVPKNTDIYFMVDLDEIIKKENWVQKIKSAWNPSFHRGVYEYYRDVVDDKNILRSIPEFRIHSKKWNKYVSIVHEVLVDETGNKMFMLEECINIDIQVWHYPKQNKKTNYLELCEQDLALYPDDYVMRLQLAIEYEIEEQLQNAYKQYNILLKEYSDKLQWFELGRCYTGIALYYYYNNNVKQALNYLREGRLQAPYYSDNYIIAAQILFQEKNYQVVLDLCKTAIEKCYRAVWCNITDIKSFLPYYLLGLSYAELNQNIESLAYLTIAEFLNSTDEIKNNQNAILQIVYNNVEKGDI